MAIINILDKQTAELIAAGEVVERPASVVKELVENSIDAGSSSILVNIENGGIRKILIKDNGGGIDSEYVKTAFIRHATSKISTKDDLDAIKSLGFRGEALASIASVSRITLTTKTKNQDFGVELQLEGGEEIDFSVKPFVNGTQLIVKDLFFNTPARMKFLKKDSTEAGYIQDIVVNLSLSHPEISFTFIKDGKEIFTTPGDDNILNTVASLFDLSFTNELSKVSYTENHYSVTGYTTYPNFSRQSRNMQFVFINNRYVKNKTIIAAVENAYKGMTMVGKFPGYILNMTIPFDMVDVNVHPAKTEVRFANDSEVFSFIYRGIKVALDGKAPVKQFSFAPKKENIFYTSANLIKGESVSNISLDNMPLQNSSNQLKLNILANIIDEKKTEHLNTPIYNDTTFKSDFNTISYENSNSSTTLIVAKNNENFDTISSNTEDSTKSFSNLDYNVKVLAQIFNTYILCEGEDELILIDKHAAHERLLYEKLKQSQTFDNQMLLSPITVNLNGKEKEAIIENLDMLTSQGFIIEDFGGNGIIVRAIPVNISGEDPQSLVLEIAENLSNNMKVSFLKKQEWILHSVACRSAIKAGDKNEIAELCSLVKDIKDKKIPLFCPHGRPVIISITKKEIEKQFGRL